MMNRVHVQRRFDPYGVEIWLVDREDRVYRNGSWQVPEPGVVSSPTLRLDHDDAQRLWAELGRALELERLLPAADTRADLLHERERVDKLIDVLTEML